MCRVAGDLGDDLGDFFDELFLALAGQRGWRSDDLDADGAGGVGGCGVDCVRVHSVDERGRVVEVEGTGGGDAFGAENGHGELLA